MMLKQGAEGCSMTMDARQIQDLQPVITLQEVHNKRAVTSLPQPQAGSIHDAASDYKATRAAANNHAAASFPTSGSYYASSSSSSIPEGISPETWVELQRTAKELDVKGIFDSKVNQLRAQMMQQVKLSKAQQVQQLQAQAARAGFGSLSGQKVTVQAAGAAGPDTSTVAGRLEASCQQVIASLPLPPPSKPSHIATSLLPAASGYINRAQATKRNTVWKAATTNTSGASGFSFAGTAAASYGAAAASSVQQQPVSTARTAASGSQVPKLALEASNSYTGQAASALPVALMTPTERLPVWLQQQQQQEQQQQVSQHSGLTTHVSAKHGVHGAQHGKSLASCVAALTAGPRPGSPHEQLLGTALFQQKLSPEQCEAFQEQVAASVDQRLKQYRDLLQQGRQQLLERELGQQEPARQRLHDAHQSKSGSTGKHAVVSAGSSSSSSGAAASSGQAADAAMLTMQQLVSLLTKRDVAPTDTAPEDSSSGPNTDEQAAPGEQRPPSSTNEAASASRKLKEARSVSQILRAANEHLQAAAQDFAQPSKLNLGAIAMAHHVGNTWHKLTVRSKGEGGRSASSASRSSQSNNTAKDGNRQDSSVRIVLQQDKPAANSQQDSRCKAGLSSAAVDASSMQQQQQQLQKPFAPAMRLPAPRLVGPTAAELAVIPLPGLPLLLDLSHEPAKVLQARLERVWEILGTPVEQQMKMVLSYTSCDAAYHFEGALEAWETAAAAVLQREGLLQQLKELKYSILQHQQEQGCQQLDPVTTMQPPLLLGLNATQVQQLLWNFLAATEHVKAADAMLQEAIGQQLLVGGHIYPDAGAIVSAAQLQPLLDQVWELLGWGVNVVDVAKPVVL